MMAQRDAQGCCAFKGFNRCLPGSSPSGNFPKSAAGDVALVATGQLDWDVALGQKIHGNVIALFAGTLVLAELFMQSRMPAVLAEIFVDRTKTVRGALIAVCVLAGILSMFVENVAVVLLVAPVAMSLADKLKISPVRLLILLTVGLAVTLDRELRRRRHLDRVRRDHPGCGSGVGVCG